MSKQLNQQAYEVYERISSLPVALRKVMEFYLLSQEENPIKDVAKNCELLETKVERKVSGSVALLRTDPRISSLGKNKTDTEFLQILQTLYLEALEDIWVYEEKRKETVIPFRHNNLNQSTTKNCGLDIPKENGILIDRPANDKVLSKNESKSNKKLYYIDYIAASVAVVIVYFYLFSSQNQTPNINLNTNNNQTSLSVEPEKTQEKQKEMLPEPTQIIKNDSLSPLKDNSHGDEGSQLVKGVGIKNSAKKHKQLVGKKDLTKNNKNIPMNLPDTENPEDKNVTENESAAINDTMENGLPQIPIITSVERSTKGDNNSSVYLSWVGESNIKDEVLKIIDEKKIRIAKNIDDNARLLITAQIDETGKVLIIKIVDVARNYPIGRLSYRINDGKTAESIAKSIFNEVKPILDRMKE